MFVLMQVQLMFWMGLVVVEVQNWFSEGILVNFVVIFRVQIHTGCKRFRRYFYQELLCICQGRLCIFHTNCPLIRFLEFLQSVSQYVV